MFTVTFYGDQATHPLEDETETESYIFIPLGSFYIWMPLLYSILSTVHDSGTFKNATIRSFLRADGVNLILVDMAFSVAASYSGTSMRAFLHRPELTRIDPKKGIFSPSEIFFPAKSLFSGQFGSV